jgi:DNA-repair protein XRCC1
LGFYFYLHFNLDASENNCSSTGAAIREVTKAISGAAQMSSEDKVKDVIRKPKKLDTAGDTNSSSSPTPRLIRNETKSSASPSRSDKLPSQNTLADAPFARKKTNQDPSSSDSLQGSVKSSPSTSTSRTSASPSPGPTIVRPKVGNSQNRNGQLSAPASSKKDEDQRSGNNLTGRANLSSPKSSSISTTGLAASNIAISKQKQKLKKPFGRLFEGVIFVMSGFENPYRRELRDKAIEMGARCKPDWDSTCTHLM